MDSVINDTLDNVLCKEAWLPHYLVNDILLFQVNTTHGHWLHSFAIFKLEIEFRNKFCPVKNVKSVGLVTISCSRVLLQRTANKIISIWLLY